MPKFTKKVAVGVSVAALVAIGGGTAFAYWTTSGSGTGSATAGTNTAVTVAQYGSISNMVPGSDPQAVDFTITNPATTNQYITKVAVSISSITKATGAVGACTTADFALTQPTDIKRDLPTGATDFAASGSTLAMIDSTSNQDGCKGATVNLAFAAS